MKDIPENLEASNTNEEKDNLPFFQTLTTEQKNLFKEWGNLFSLTHNPPPKNLEIGTVVMPTGDWLDRLRPSQLKQFLHDLNGAN